MNILDNDLVRKYFGCEGEVQCCQNHMQMKILDAMQQPIQKGERYLNLFDDGSAKLCVAEQKYPSEYNARSLYKLRLPDEFQKQECNRNCSNTHSLLGQNPCPCNCHPWPNRAGNESTPSSEKCVGQHGVMCSCMANALKPKDAVEEKIEFMKRFWRNGIEDDFATELRDLVWIARETRCSCTVDTQEPGCKIGHKF